MKNLLILSFVSVLFFSCKKENETESLYKGTWTGNYTGSGDNGSFILNVAGNGTIKGSAVSSVFSQTYSTTGSVDATGSVSVNTAGSLSSGAVFSGTMNLTTGSGVWTNNSTSPNYNGTWIANKQ